MLTWRIWNETNRRQPLLLPSLQIGGRGPFDDHVRTDFHPSSAHLQIPRPMITMQVSRALAVRGQWSPSAAGESKANDRPGSIFRTRLEEVFFFDYTSD